MVERNLAKVDVVGSNPIIRSQNKNGASSDVPFLFCMLMYKGFELATSGQTATLHIFCKSVNSQIIVSMVTQNFAHIATFASFAA